MNVAKCGSRTKIKQWYRNRWYCLTHWHSIRMYLWVTLQVALFCSLNWWHPAPGHTNMWHDVTPLPFDRHSEILIKRYGILVDCRSLCLDGDPWLRARDWPGGLLDIQRGEGDLEAALVRPTYYFTPVVKA